MRKIIDEIKNLDAKILKIMKYGLTFSFYFCIIATLVLATYELYSAPSIFYAGISLLKSGLFFVVTTTICGFAFNKIKQEI